MAIKNRAGSVAGNWELSYDKDLKIRMIRINQILNLSDISWPNYINTYWAIVLKSIFSGKCLANHKHGASSMPKRSKKISLKMFSIQWSKIIRPNKLFRIRKFNICQWTIKLSNTINKLPNPSLLTPTTHSIN